jgi:hypothetical protein
MLGETPVPPSSKVRYSAGAALLAFAISFFAGLTTAQQFERTPTPYGTDSQVRFKDTPVAKTAPPALRRLIEEGDVSVEFTNDPELVLADKGKAAWHWEAKRNFRDRYATASQDGTRTVHLTVTQVTQDIRVSHRVRIPTKYYANTPRVWVGRLLRHEFDHVAISTDPRARMLAQYVVQHATPFDRNYQETLRRLHPFGDRCVIHRQTSRQAAAEFRDRSLDFVYLDARHYREALLEDLELWAPKLRHGGILAGHDYLDGTLPSRRFEVKSTVDGWAAARRLTVCCSGENVWRSWFIQMP